MLPIPVSRKGRADQTWAAAASKPAPEPISAANVAATILEAATDRTQRLRYLVGNDTRGLIAALDLPMAEREPRLRELLG
jgi:hypothetical protein